MSLPIGDPSRVFYSQRVDPKPWVNCLPYSLCPVLAYMGYAVPRDYGSQLRKASGVPMAEGRGTSYADMERALERILPDAPVTFGAVDDGELINLLARKAKPNTGHVVSVTARMERLPAHLRRHVGKGWEGLHALTLHMRRKAPDGTWLVYLSDPMGRTYRGYTGEWVRWGDISPALKRNANGLVRVGYGKRGEAV
jgi:hypothetical protein